MKANEKKEIIDIVAEMKKQLENFNDKLSAIESKLKTDEVKDASSSVQYRSPIKPIQNRKNSF